MSQIHNLSRAGDSRTEHDVEFGFAERRSHLVLDNLHAYLVTQYFISIFQRGDAADIQTDRSVELQCVTTGRRLRITEHDADLLTQLVDEDAGRIGLADGSCQLTECL